jgi:hypothetical protein
MTDFRNTIETTAASVEDLSEDLEAHLGDILDADVEVVKTDLCVSKEDNPYLRADVVLPGVETALEDRLGGTVDARSMTVYIDPEQEVESR